MTAWTLKHQWFLLVFVREGAHACVVRITSYIRERAHT
jgi:hypothetical protein